MGEFRNFLGKRRFEKSWRKLEEVWKGEGRKKWKEFDEGWSYVKILSCIELVEDEFEGEDWNSLGNSCACERRKNLKIYVKEDDE